MNGNINFYDGFLIANDASSQRSRSDNPNRVSMVQDSSGQMLGVGKHPNNGGNTNNLQFLNLKHRSISNDNNNNKKSIQSINSSETGGGGCGTSSHAPSVNANLLKQSQDPNVNKRLAQRDYLKYSAFCQLSNNNGDDDSKSYMTQQHNSKA